MAKKDHKTQKSDKFTIDQLNEIKEGKDAGLDISIYAKPEYYAIQMRQIRFGLMEGLPVEVYAKPEYDWFQMEEIRKGLKSNLNVQRYADPNIPYDKMRQVREGLMDGLELHKYLQFDAGVLRELRKAMLSKVNIISYIKQGYDAEQLEEIRIALEKKLNIIPYLLPELRGVSIAQIRLGLERGLDVSAYAKVEYSWRQMREIRLGLENRVDISVYAKPLYNWQQMREIRLGLEAGIDVSAYTSLMWTASDMKRKRQEVHGDDISQELLDILAGKKIEPEENEYFTVSISQDEMEAYFEVRRENIQLQREKIENILAMNGIRAGIIEEAVQTLSKGGLSMQKVLIAKGQEAVHGTDGWYEYFFKLKEERRPLMLSDGSVDYQNTQWFEIVEKGQKIAYYHEACIGSEGYTVTGRVLPAHKGREQSVLAGRGFILMPDQKTYVAAESGKVELRGNLLEVTKLLVLQEVKMPTGKVDFDGSVYVRGNVGIGTTIKATEDVFVDGYVEATRIECGGSIVLRQGINAAGQGYLKAGKGVAGRFFESAKVYAGELIQANYCMNSELYTDGKVIVSGEFGALVGGMIQAVRGLDAYNVGNRVGIPTYLKIGINDTLIKQQYEIEARMTEVEKELSILQNAYHDLQKKYPIEVRRQMDIYLKIESAIYTKEQQKDYLVGEKAKMDERMTAVNDAKAVIHGNCCEGVLIEINGIRWSAKEVRNVTIIRTGNRIAIFEN